MNRNLGFLWLILVMLASPAAGWQSKNDHPNFVVVLADDMGYGDVSALNADSNPNLMTPNLDRLAEQGMVFLDAHSPSGVCTPTRYGLLTGRYCWRTRLKSGVLGGYSKPLLQPNRSTIASMLKQLGYSTGAVGKWHLGMQLPLLSDDANVQQWAGDPGIDFGGVITDSPIHHGFDEYFGVCASLDMAPYVFVQDDRFTRLPTIQQPAVKFPHFVRQGPRAADFEIDQVLDRITEKAVDFIERNTDNASPFFLFVPLTAPHKPTQPKQEFRGKTGLGEYGDFVAQVDDSVGRILEALDAAAIVENTVFVYTSDNGSYMYRFDEAAKPDHIDDDTVQGYRAENHRANGPYRGTKADIYEGGHRVPFLIRWPGHIAAGSKCDQTICLTDLYATFAELAGHSLQADEAEDSGSLVAMLEGQQVSRGAPVIHHSAAGMFAIRDGRWKLILGNGSGGRENPKGKPFQKPYQLYDMSADAGEQENVASQQIDKVDQLVQHFEQIRQSGRSFTR